MLIMEKYFPTDNYMSLHIYLYKYKENEIQVGVKNLLLAWTTALHLQLCNYSTITTLIATTIRSSSHSVF